MNTTKPEPEGPVPPDGPALRSEAATLAPAAPRPAPDAPGPSSSAPAAGDGGPTGAPEESADPGDPPAASEEAPAAEPVRRSPVIASETTTEIPIHLLFRDDDVPPALAPARRASVINRRMGTGEQPRVSAAGRPVAGPGARSGPAARPKAAPDPGTVPVVDPRLTERPGPVLPGWIGLVAGAFSLAGIGALVWGTGAVPGMVGRMLGVSPPPYQGIGLGVWCLLALGVLLALFGLGGLGRGRVGHAWVLTLCGDYRGSVRRTGLVWVSPLVLRRRIDVRLRHWRSDPMPVHDADGTALRVVVLVVWRVADTVRAALGVEDHEEYLAEQVESATARVLSQLPADGFGEAVPTLRDARAVGAALTETLAAQCAPVGVEVFTAQPVVVDYAPEVAEAVQRRQIAAIDARHRDAVLSSVVDAVEDAVGRLTDRGLVDREDYERKALVKDLTVAFYTGRAGAAEAP
ncbi:SPFH domain-containing protein [Streptomyces sp. C10-9-1]|uniref:SPFH domain-containing protein n=1 Tax=Streptomyces sp. C10-9-1 TaxID=1859285 RepID=UPI0021130954|nr:SPFH domain-containing protein [Streptomyces sp. C10-9-1]MCQ6553048.1 SPFH domain-containing protein [Streptomyces sp. C10-9-1]